MKSLIGKIHLWLGLASGIVVLIVSLTGCIYVFSKEISGLLRKEAMYTEQQSGEMIPVSKAWKQAEKLILA